MHCQLNHAFTLLVRFGRCFAKLEKFTFIMTTVNSRGSWSQHHNQHGLRLSLCLKAFHVTVGSEEVGVHFKKLVRLP